MTLECCSFPSLHWLGKSALFCRRAGGGGGIFAVFEKRLSNSRFQADTEHLEFSGVYHQQYMSVKVKIKGSRREGQSEEEIIVG